MCILVSTLQPSLLYNISIPHFIKQFHKKFRQSFELIPVLAFTRCKNGEINILEWQGNRMKKSAKFVKNNGSKENIIKRAAKPLSLHAEFDRDIGPIKIERNVTNNR